MPERLADAAALRLAAIVEFADDAIVSKDVNGTITSWNRAAERMFGYTATEAVGKSITIIIPPDRLDEEKEVLARIRRGEAVETFETIRQRKDGTSIPISLTVSPMRRADGTIIGASTIARDITERRKTEAALARAEERHLDLQRRLVALVAASGSLFVSPRVVDVLPAIIDVARALIPADGYALWRLEQARHTWRVAASSGVSDEFGQDLPFNQGRTVTALPFSEPLVAEDVEAVPMLEERRQHYRAEGIVSLLAVPLTIGGAATGTLVFYFRTRHAFDTVELLTARSLANLVAAAVATAELYDDQRRIREEAERAKRQAAFLADVSGALSSSLDYEVTLRSVASLAVPHIADWCAVDIVDEHGGKQRLAAAHVDPTKVELARTLQERHPDDPNSPHGFYQVVRSGQPEVIADVTADMIGEAAKDDEHLAELQQLSISSYMCVPLLLHGRTLGALTFVMAESGRRYDEADLRFAQDVAYRAALAVENARAYRNANAANRAKDEFLATLSHELRTPLNAVLGWTRMLRASAVPAARVPRALEVIERNAVAQTRLVEDLLDLSRIITGNFRLEVQSIHVRAAVDAAIETIQPAAAAKEITVSLAADPRVDLVLGDAARLQQVVWNLLSNAVKFTPHGGRVSVSLRATESDVEVEVADTGEGIPPDVLPYVFDRFRQGDSGPTRTHSGLGLGLAIVRHIVELHGGRVEVSSAGKGQGATFRLSLPAVARDEMALAFADKGGRSVGRVADERLAGVRALVVDDDPDARELLTELLKDRGVRVTAAGSMAEGLAAFDREPPDIILSDLAMPDHDGFELIRRVRERPAESGGEVPAIAITAYARPQDCERSLASGFQAHLAKPVDTSALFSAVAKLAGKAEGSA